MAYRPLPGKNTDTVSERVPCVSSIMANQVLGDIVICINLLVRFYGVTIHTNETSLKDLLNNTIQFVNSNFFCLFFFVSLHLKHETQPGSTGQRLKIKILGQ